MTTFQSCDLDREDAVGCQEYGRGRNEASRSVGIFDRNSIMNYCANFEMLSKGVKPTLSDGDISTIRKLYNREINDYSIDELKISTCYKSRGIWKFDRNPSCCEQVTLEKSGQLSERLEGTTYCL